jgi:hypothetical protein
MSELRDTVARILAADDDSEQVRLIWGSAFARYASGGKADLQSWFEEVLGAKRPIEFAEGKSEDEE